MLRPGERVVVAEALSETVRKVGQVEEWSALDLVSAEHLADVVCDHPLRGQGYDFDVRLFVGDFVTVGQGTGFVHT